jgi:hypothetical protein
LGLCFGNVDPLIDGSENNSVFFFPFSPSSDANKSSLTHSFLFLKHPLVKPDRSLLMGGPHLSENLTLTPYPHVEREKEQVNDIVLYQLKNQNNIDIVIPCHYRQEACHADSNCVTKISSRYSMWSERITTASPWTENASH